MKMVCLKIDEWIPSGQGPKYGEIVTLTDVSKEGYYTFKEYPQDYAYNPQYFKEMEDFTPAISAAEQLCFA